MISVAYLAIAPALPEPVAGTDASSAYWRPVDESLAGDVRLAFDHWRILADGVERAREKLERTALATAFCGPTFTIAELRTVYEAVWGAPLDPRNFYRKVRSVDGFIVPVEATRRTDGGRAGPAVPGRALTPHCIPPWSGLRSGTPVDKETS